MHHADWSGLIGLVIIPTILSICFLWDVATLISSAIQIRRQKNE